MQTELKTTLDFNAKLAFNQLKEDLIEVAIHPNKYNFTITAKDNNPYVWIVKYNKFKKDSLIAKGIEHMEEESILHQHQKLVWIIHKVIIILF